MARYRFQFPDGRVHESESAPARIREIHPDAVITHEIVLGADGRFAGMVPYRDTRAAPVEAAAASEPETSAVKRVVKKAG